MFNIKNDYYIIFLFSNLISNFKVGIYSSLITQSFFDFGEDFLLHVLTLYSQEVELVVDEDVNLSLLLLDVLDPFVKVLVTFSKLRILSLDKFLELLRLLIELVLDELSNGRARHQYEVSILLQGNKLRE